MPMSATVVCNNILKRAFSESVAVSPMKLQKILYFVSCEYVKATGNDLFSEDFGVWQYGPVLPTVYDEFKSFKSTPINKYATDANGIAYAIDEDSAPNLKTAIVRIWNSFKFFDGVTLSKITHKDGSGWSNAFCQHRSKITTEDMRSDNTYGEYLLT